MTDADPTLTADDVAWLDRTSMGRSAKTSRLAGSILAVVGVVVAVAWLWTTVRQQQDLSDAFIGGSAEPGASFAERIDVAVSQLGLLVTSGILVGVGLLLRLLADHVAFAAGVSPLGLEAGDPSPLADASDDGDDDDDDDRSAEDDESSDEPAEDD
jgi:hypothetical protein